MLIDNFPYSFKWIQFIAFFVAIVISYLVTPYVQQRSLKLGLLDKPSKRKLHKVAVPRLGGVSIYLSLFLTSLMFIFAYFDQSTISFSAVTLLGIFAGGTIIFILGFLDDIDPLPASLKLLLQILAASIAWLLGVRILQIVNPFYHADFLLFKLSLGQSTIYFNLLFSYIVTIIWIVGITNAINLVDGMDGLATGISLISAIAIWAVAVDYRINQPSGALMAAILAGALLGFLRWNFNPARIFLGDSGAYLTGFVLAALTVSSVVKKVTFSVMTPVLFLIFALPILDTAFAVARRIMKGKSILEPDKEHLHHRILSFGLSQKITSYVLYILSATLGYFATCFISYKSSLRYLVLIAIVVSIAFFYTFIINWKHQKFLRDFF